jgi:hypothetical protein
LAQTQSGRLTIATPSIELADWGLLVGRLIEAVCGLAPVIFAVHARTPSSGSLS